MADWATHVAAWSSPPVDHLNSYLPSKQLLALPDDELRRLVEGMAAERFGGWRNHNGLWRDVLGLDSTHGKRILDFGCGVGLEALELVRAGNTVDVADISLDNLALADRVIQVFGYTNRRPLRLPVTDQPPFITSLVGQYDVFHCSGVLHHCRWPRDIMARAHQLLVPGGRARLMLYSDEGWRQATGTEPPENAEAHPLFEQFVRHFDQVGDYADWYDAPKIERWFGQWFDIDRAEYLTPWGQYLAVDLIRKDTAEPNE